jgi:hypothetical protein
VAIVLLELLWAQLHGSFVLAPALFAIVGLRCLVSTDGGERRAALALLLCLVLGLTTSAYGGRIFELIAGHTSGDSVRHNSEMTGPSWDDFNPAEKLYGPVYVVLWLIGIAGALLARRVPGTAFALAATSCVLGGMGSVRFFAETAVLMVPWALFGAAQIAGLVRVERAATLAAYALLAVTLALGLRRVNADHGPLGRIGFDTKRYPFQTAKYLAGTGRELELLTTFEASAALGFLLYGRARTYVDGRSPLYFDDTEHALSRDVFNHVRALELAARRFDVDAIVLDRESPVCSQVPAGYRLAMLDRSVSTFERSGERARFSALAACGEDYLAADACADRSRLDGEITALERVGRNSLTDYLRALAAVRCGGDLRAAEQTLRRLRSADLRDDSVRRLLASVLVRRGDIASAFDLVEPDFYAGRLDALQVLGPNVFSGDLSRDRVKAALRALLVKLDDGAPYYARLALTRVCMRARDEECVRFQALRAAVTGAPAQAVSGALQWLAEHHSQPSVRRDAVAWWNAIKATP